MKQILNQFITLFKRVKPHNIQSITPRLFDTKPDPCSSPCLSELYRQHLLRRGCAVEAAPPGAARSEGQSTAAALLCRKVREHASTVAQGAGGTDALVASQLFAYGCHEERAPDQSPGQVTVSKFLWIRGESS